MKYEYGALAEYWRGKRKYFEQNLSQRNTVHGKSPIDRKLRICPCVVAPIRDIIRVNKFFDNWPIPTYGNDADVYRFHKDFKGRNPVVWDMTLCFLLVFDYPEYRDRSSSETSVTNYKSTRCHNPPDCNRHSFQNGMSSHLLPQNVQIKIYKTTILPSVLYGRKTYSLWHYGINILS
jgi:hypothetical protein